MCINLLKLKEPDGIHGWSIVFQSEHMDEVTRFVDVCKANLSKELGWFHQAGVTPSGLDNYQCFEFLLVSSEIDEIFSLMLKDCMRISYIVGERLQVTRY